MDIERVIADYDKLVDRALAIVDEAPYWTYVGEKEYARLSVTKGMAALTWPENKCSYGEYYIEPQKAEFPANLLTMGDTQFAAWKAEQKSAYDREQAAMNRARTEAAQQQELAILAALKAKYEGAH